MTDDELRAAITEHGSIRAAAKAVGMHESSIRRRVQRTGEPLSRPHGKTPAVTTGPKVRGLSEFLERHDKATIIPNKIKEGLAKLGSGWMPEAEFLQLIHVTPTDMGMYRDQFADHWLLTPGERKRAWFGRSEDCATMRERL